MSQNNNPYGGGVPEPQSLTGEVSGFAMVHYDMNDNNSLEIHFQKEFASGKSITIKLWFNDVDPERVTPFGEETKEVAVSKAFTKLRRNVWNIIRNYADEQTITAAQKRANSWETLVSESKACLPADYSTKQGRLVVGYNSNGYLATPRGMQWDSDLRRYVPFFSVSEEQQLCSMPSNLSLIKPESDAPASNVVDDDGDDF